MASLNRTSASRLTIYLLATAASAFASAAWAQAAPSAASAPTGAPSTVGEIVVTATRESTQVSKVPISISAYSQKDLDSQGVRTFSDIIALTPGINLIAASTFQSPSISIRGVQSSVGAQTTGIYIDDVPIQDRVTGGADPGSALPKIFDLSRVEVLRGPQGTLFGAGAEGGAVRFITPTPSLTTLSTYARGEVSGTDHGGVNYEAGAAVGGPLVADKLGFRVSAWGRQDSGWIDRINPNTGRTQQSDSNAQSSQAVKLSLLFQPGSAFSVAPSLYFQTVNSKDATQYYTGLSNPGAGNFVSGRTFAQPNKDAFYLPSLTLVGNVGGLTLTSVTSYFTRRKASVADFSQIDWDLQALFQGKFPLPLYPPDSYSGSPFYQLNQQNNITQEFRIQPETSEGRLHWVAGLFFSQNRQSADNKEVDASLAPFFSAFTGAPNVNGNLVFTDALSDVDKQVAGFANVDYNLTSTLKLTAGVRVARTTFSYVDVGAGSVNGGPHTNRGSQSETPVTPKFSLAWQRDPENLYYFTYAQGYRVGGANQPVPSTPPCILNLQQIGLTQSPLAYNSDTTDSFELGAKNRLFGGMVQVASSAFHINWQNIQQAVRLPNCAGSFISNLGSASSNGFDVAITARPSSNLTLSGTAGYTNVSYDKTLSSGGLNIVDKGSQISDNPPWQASVTAQYEFDLMNRRPYVRVTDEYSSRNGGTFTNLDDPKASAYDPTLVRNPAFNRLNLRAGVMWNGADIAFFADNTLDAHPQLYNVHNLVPDRVYYATTLTPRVVGVTISYRR